MREPPNPHGYEPQNGFERMVMRALGELHDFQSRHQHQHDRLEPGIRLYEKMVPLGIERWLPELLDQAASSEFLRRLNRRRLKTWVALGGIGVLGPAYLGLVLEIGHLLGWWR